MDVEQPSLGRIGVDSVTVGMDWHWEGGWSLRFASRLSGSQSWREWRYEALSDDEVLPVLQEAVAEVLGLV